MIFDPHDEEKQVIEWSLSELPEGYDLQKIIEPLLQGFERCEDYCSSREQSGEDACYCVRAAFPTPEAYELYQALKEDSAKIAALTILSNVTGSKHRKN